MLLPASLGQNSLSEYASCETAKKLFSVTVREKSRNFSDGDGAIRVPGMDESIRVLC